jgi:acyl carrier protein
MGLDTVELLITVEKHFDISISNNEAEKISTVQDFADYVYNKVSLNTSERCKSQLLFYKIKNHFIGHLDVSKDHFLPDAKIKDLLRHHDLQSAWNNIQKHLQLELPALAERDFDPLIQKDIKILGFKVYTRGEPVTEGSVKDLVNWTLALNHKKLMDVKNLCSKKEIEWIIVGIVSESSGVPVNEIKMMHSFTDDLGMD